MQNEEEAIVLDYLPRGRGDSYKSEPIAQILGTRYFTLLEVVTRTSVQPLERVYIGKEKREKVEFIKRRISSKELTSNANAELEKAIQTVIEENRQKFLDFFNKSTPITIKRHQLELLPGLGKKHLLAILAEREQKPFESLEEIEKRVHLMPSIIPTIIKRIVEELSGEEKHYLFVKPFVEKKEFENTFFKKRF